MDLTGVSRTDYKKLSEKIVNNTGERFPFFGDRGAVFCLRREVSKSGKKLLQRKITDEEYLVWCE